MKKRKAKTGAEDRHLSPRVTFYYPPKQLAKLDKYVASLPHRPTRGQVIRDAIDELLRRAGG